MNPAFGQILLNFEEPAYAVDRGGNIVAWNYGAEKAFGYSADVAKGSRCWKLLGGEDVYGNAYCGERCPHRDMAARHESINRSVLRLRTGEGRASEFSISTLVMTHGPDNEVLVHLCNPVEDDPRGGPVAKPIRREKASSAIGILTPREMEVLNCLSEGYSTRHISDLLHISVPTVRNHVEHLMHKLNTHSRLEAVAAARRIGLLDDS